MNQAQKKALALYNANAILARRIQYFSLKDIASMAIQQGRLYQIIHKRRDDKWVESIRPKQTETSPI